MAVATKAAATGQQWTEETFLNAARTRRPDAEVVLIERLLKDVHARGVKLGWGKGVTPGVSGWYLVAGQPAAVWNLNISAETPTARAYLYFYLADLATRLPVDAIERAGSLLESIPAMAPKIAGARANDWKKYPSVYLTDVVTSPTDMEALFNAIAILLEGTVRTSTLDNRKLQSRKSVLCSFRLTPSAAEDVSGCARRCRSACCPALSAG
jgi:hypothetical protein